VAIFGTIQRFKGLRIEPVQGQRERILPQIPAGRFGKPEEVASAAVFLCSESAAYTNGAVLNINGGVYT